MTSAANNFTNLLGMEASVHTLGQGTKLQICIQLLLLDRSGYGIGRSENGSDLESLILTLLTCCYGCTIAAVYIWARY